MGAKPSRNCFRQQQTSYQFSQSNQGKRKYTRVADNYRSLEEVTAALESVGLESSNLIVGVDFNKSNEWTGKNSFDGQSLHHISDVENMYGQAITMIGRTLSTFDEDDLIPCFGFGDASTKDQNVFNFYPYGHPCFGFDEVLSRYKEIVPRLKLSESSTSFAPIIEMATTIVEGTGGQYHVLLIIGNGQVTRSENANTAGEHFSPQESRTVDAIVRASQYPLSIVFIGVGDGPWDIMKEFDHRIPQRAFDNFTFVNFTEIMSKDTNQMQKEEEFYLQASRKIPMQFTKTIDLGILGRRTGASPGRVALPMPTRTNVIMSSSLDQINSNWTNSTNTKATSSAASLLDNDLFCPVCLDNTKDMAFGCGHRMCCGCGLNLQLSRCPICRGNVVIRIKLLSDE